MEISRDKEIRDAIDTIIPIFPSNNGRTYEQALIASGFEAGVKWADKNPKSPWISVDEDLPCNHEELIIDKPLYKRTKSSYVISLAALGLTKWFMIWN